MRRLLCLFVIFGPASAAFAQTDLSGYWLVLRHEDNEEIGPGTLIADYTGAPINEAARERALMWHPSVMNQPERQCMLLPLEYVLVHSNTRLWQEVDSNTQELLAYRFRKEWGAGERSIYMDKRPHPPEYAPHTAHGFSTGEWEGDILKVTTTHLKEGYLRRNGTPRSDRATIIEHYIRHGNYLTISILVNDPVYLTEPWIRTVSYVQTVTRSFEPYPCESVVELEHLQQGYVPHYFYWKNPFLREFADLHGMPLSAAMGGAAQMYPAFIEKEHKEEARAVQK